ncbi:cytidine deaminase [Streptomyces sp. A7024]|uniref:Cytidine deaminase n=1 Tax=Streptomyces coryli TaxID=1128680 RepID=A0A6G4TWQ3_9ACTN|nr:cytidine deaminase [Streptomyces coryli]NGN64405.1 cytidine deaminase [Streptomyces coryli]
MTAADLPDATRPVNWTELREEARAVMARAYAPYSNYPVGAAALVDDGRTVSGCNVENSAYGVALCAECGLVSQLHATGGGRLAAFSCVNGAGDIILPCGRCRQLLYEHGGDDLLIDTPNGVRTLGELLPEAFGPADLERMKP